MSDPVPFYSQDGLHPAVYDLMHERSIRGTSVEGDEAWFAARAREWGGPVLEGACGSGRVAWEVARAGVEVVGFDRSPGMLARAEAKRASMPPEVASRATFRAADLRTFDLGRTFPCAFVPFRSFQVLLEPEDQVACLGAFRRHLDPGGRLVLDLFDPKYEFLLPGVIPVRDRGTFVHPERGTSVSVTIGEREVDAFRQCFSEEWIFEERDEAGTVVREEREMLRMRWNFRYEMLHLFARCGFEVEAEYSDFQGGAPAYAKEQVWVLRRT